MPIEQPPDAQHACMFCVKQFPTELKAQMKARAATERKSLRTWLCDQMRTVLAAVPTTKRAKRSKP